MKNLTNESIVFDEPILPDHYWFNLKDCCRLKGLNYKTACNKKWLQPNKGVPDGIVGGRKVWAFKTVKDWILKTDSEIKL